MAFLVAKPVDEKTELPVNLEHGDEHRNRNAERGDPAQESDDQAETTEKLRRDGQIRERRGNPDLIPKRLYRRAEAVTAEPTQKFLRAVGEEGDSKDHSRHREHPISIRG